MSQAFRLHFRWRWVFIGLYSAYCLGILVWWLWAWNPNDGMLRWLGWWSHFAPSMILPTLPSSLSLGVALRLEPKWLGDWLAHHDYICLALTWAWLAVVGYFQWFVIIPRVFSWVRRLVSLPQKPCGNAH